MNGSAGERWRKKQSDKPPQVDYYWVSPKSISPNNIQVLPWIWWPFSLGCKRPAPFHAPTREAGKQARQASCLLRLFLSPSPLHHLSPTRRPAASSTHAPLMCCLWHHQKTLSCSDLCVCVCVCVLTVGVFSPGWDLPLLTVTVPLPQLSRGAPLSSLNTLSFSPS